MRLIDADELKKAIVNTPSAAAKEAGKRRAYIQILSALAQRQHEILDLIYIAPTCFADAKCGEWIEDEYGFYSCSACGYEWDESEYRTFYCPDCGAKMDGDDVND